jgi:DNA-binding MarR family transcriptional regulator
LQEQRFVNDGAARNESSGDPGRARARSRSFPAVPLNVLATLVSNALAQIYAERFGLTVPAWRVIATLGQYRVRTARDIAQHGVMHKSTVSRAVSSLEERGLVARKANSADRREELLELTREGRRIYDNLVPEALAFEADLLQELTPAEQRAFMGAIPETHRPRASARAQHRMRVGPHLESGPSVEQPSKRLAAGRRPRRTKETAMGPFPHDAPPPGHLGRQPYGTDGFEFVEYCHPTPEELDVLFKQMGFSPRRPAPLQNVTL